MPWRQPLLQNGYRALQRWRCFAASASRSQRAAKIVARQSHVRTFLAEQPLFDFEPTTVILLRLLAAAARGECCGEIVQGRRNFVMLRPKAFPNTSSARR